MSLECPRCGRLHAFGGPCCTSAPKRPPPWPSTAPSAHQKGWECPRCGRVYAPFVPECGPCNTDARTACRPPATFNATIPGNATESKQ